MALDFLNITDDPVDIGGQYKVEPKKWYKAYPYGFAFWQFDEDKADFPTETFWLPIAPNNINVTTHYATNIITTLYGIIEEHSEVRYYDIVISGNTGIAPKYTVPFASSPDGGPIGGYAKNSGAGIQTPSPPNPGSPSIGRSSFGSADSAGVLGGFLPEVTNSFAAAANLVKSIKNGASKNEAGFEPTQSGYYAFHNLYKFLLRYKVDASKAREVGANTWNGRSQHPLQFLNHKDNIQYDCIPISFTLVRTADNPMLYQYNIKLRAFNLRNVNEKDTAKSDNLLAELGLGNLSGSVFSTITGVVGKASTLLSGIRGAF